MSSVDLKMIDDHSDKILTMNSEQSHLDAIKILMVNSEHNHLDAIKILKITHHFVVNAIVSHLNQITLVAIGSVEDHFKEI